jgi:hypothetical protein
MQNEMTIEDARNVVNVLSDDFACDANEDVLELATAARQLVRHIQSSQVSSSENEPAGEVWRVVRRVPDGGALKLGIDGGVAAISWRVARCTPARRCTSYVHRLAPGPIRIQDAAP